MDARGSHGALPAHDEKTDAVLIYAEDVTTVQPNGKIKNLRRRVSKSCGRREMVRLGCTHILIRRRRLQE